MYILDLDEIIDSVDIVEYVSQFIELEDKGDEFFGFSPFNEENTPSFTVTPETQLFYDFSAKIGGNVLNFIQSYYHCDFKKAVELLKQYAGVSGSVETTTRLLAAQTMKKYKEKEKRTKEKSKRSILPNDVMQTYETEISKLETWLKEGISEQVLKKYQVRYDPVSNRIVYPIRDVKGNIISVKGRTLDKDFKQKRLRKYTYLNSIGDIDFIFGLWENLDYIKKEGKIILFEGEKSVMKMETWGYKNVGAILTSHLNPRQLKLLISLRVTVVFALDKGIDITKDENINKLRKYTRVEFIKDKNEILDEKDAPVDKGKDNWERLYKERWVLL